jgi:predicted transcriptional regulator
MHSTPNVTVVSPATAISEIARKMRDEDIGVTLVVEEERLIGVVAHEPMSPRLQYWSFHDVLANRGASPVRRLPA